MPDNPFAQYMPSGSPDASAAIGVTANNEDVGGGQSQRAANPFAQYMPTDTQPEQTSAAGVFARSALQGVAPAAGGLVGAGMGAKLFGGLGLAAGTALGLPEAGVGEIVTAPLLGAVGAVAGGVVGGIGGASAVQAAQNWALHRLPIKMQEHIGVDEQQQRLDQMQHPDAAFLGGTAPYLLTMSPMGIARGGAAAGQTTMQRVLTNPLTARVVGGAVMGGMTLGQEKVEGQPTDWGQVAVATGLGMLFNRPNKLGARITNFGEGLVTPPSPTLAQAADGKVMGPGINEAVFQGEQEQNPVAQQAAQSQAANEQMVMQPPPKRDAGDVARQMHPELFAAYDDLQAQADAVRGYIDRIKNPPDEDIEAAQERLNYAKGQLEDATQGAFGPNRAANVPRLRAAVADAQAEFDDLNARRESWRAGNSQDTPEVAQARQHLMDLNDQIARMAVNEIAPAMRRGAEAAEAQVIEPPQAAQPAPEAAPAAATAEQANIQAEHDAIVADRTAQLIAAGQSPELAEANAKIEAAAWVTRAARFEGKLGGPLAMYRAESTPVKGGRGVVPGAAPPPAAPAPLMPTPAKPDLPPVQAGVTKGGDLLSITPADIGVDASRFQFKAGGDAAGVTERLQGVQQWDPRLAGTTLVWRDQDGRLWIADGHQRLALAQRLAQTQPGIKINAFVLNAADGITDADARAIAAAKNIAEGTGTAIDAAKVIRDAKNKGISLPPLPPRSALVRDGQGLANLSPEAFGMAVNDVVPVNQAAIVGRLVDDPLVQLEAMRVLAKAKPDNVRQAEMIVRQINETGTQMVTQSGGLFGDEQIAKSAVLERAQIADLALQQIRRDKTTFKTLVDEAERIESHGRNALDTELNQTRLTSDEQAAQLLTRLATRRGPVSDALTAIARRYQSGDLSAAAAAREFSGVVRGAIKGGLEQGADVGGPEFGATGQREVGEAAAAPAEAPDEGPSLFQRTAGKLRTLANGRRIMFLAKNADASTFIHEMAHDWLFRLVQDADHPDAPQSIKDDVAAILKRFGMKNASELHEVNEAGNYTPKARAAHETWAQGFEKYVMEGQAPSRALASTFEKFKAWLTAVYQAIKFTGKPINEDMRGWFDRMLAQNPERKVIAAERARQPGIAQVHEVDAAEIAPEHAEAAADRVAAERRDYIAKQQGAVANEIASQQQAASASEGAAEPGAGGEADNGAERGGDVVQGGGEPQPVAPSGERGDERGALGGGRSETETKGAGLSKPEPGPAAGARSTAAAEQPSGKPGVQSLIPQPKQRLGGATSPTVDLAGNIRVENLTDQESIAQAIHDSADRNNDFQAARGGPMTAGQMSDLADAMGLDASGLNKRKLETFLGGTQNLGARILAARRLVVQSAEIVSAAMQKAANGTDEDVVALAQAIARHDMIQSALAGVTAEWGRAGTAFRSLMGGWDKAADLNQFLKDNTGRDLFQIRQIAKLGAQLDKGASVSKFVRDAGKHSFGRMILEYWINGLISGPSTHATYIVGNLISSVWHSLIEVPLASGIGNAARTLGREGEVIPIGESVARLSGAGRAVVPAINAVVESLKTGKTIGLPGETDKLLPLFGMNELRKAGMYNPDAGLRDLMANTVGIFTGLKDGIIAGHACIQAGGEPGAPAIGWKYSLENATPDLHIRGVTVLPIGEAVRLPSRLVNAVHTFFRCVNYSTENAGQAYRIAHNEGLTNEALAARFADLRQNPTQAMMEQNSKTASDLTLMGQAGKLTRSLTAITNHEFNVPGLGKTQLLKFIDPFVTISSNIFDQSIIQRTPVGFFFEEVREDILGKNGNAAQDLAVAKMVAGTALAITFAGLAAEGYATGAGPTDPRQAEMWRLAGNQANSVRIGDMWYQVNRLGPLGLLVGTAADMFDVAHEASQADMSAMAGAFLKSIGKNFLDESFMAGPAEFMRAVQNPDSYGNQYVQQFVASFVPYSVGMTQIARALDPYQRQVRGYTDAIKNKIPWYSETLLPRRDVWGNPMPNASAFGGRAISAIYEQQISNDPVNRAMENLGIYPAQLKRSIRGVELSDDEYDDLCRIAGRLAKQRLNAVVLGSEFRNWPPEAQHDVMLEIINQNREIARNIMMMKYPDIGSQATALRIKKAEGGDLPNH